MKKLFALSLLSLTTALPAAEESWALNNSFSVWAEAAYFRRTGVPKVNLIETSSATTDDPNGNTLFNRLCNTKDLIKKFKFEPGARGGISYSNEWETFEATYLWLKEWQGSVQASDPGALYLSQKHLASWEDYSAADHAHAHYTSEFQNGEFNYIRQMTRKGEDYFAASWLIGLRYLNLNEHFQLSYTAGSNSSHYNIETTNYLAALQAGASLQWNPIRNLTWDLVGKVGVAYNWARQKTHAGDMDNALVIYNEWASKQQFPPFVGDVALKLGYQCFKNLKAHVGYQVIYANGMALAPNQIHKNIGKEARIKVDGAPLIYGLFGGVTLTW